jgi:magnesium transporter
VSITKGLSLKPSGSSPGSVIYVGKGRAEPVSIARIWYGEDGFEPKEKITAAQCKLEPDRGGVAWYTIDGIHQVETLKKIGENFNLHSLVVEDIVNTTQRPKLEDYEGYLFVTLKMLSYNRESRRVDAEHVSIICGNGYVLSFLEDEGDLFEPVRQRIAAGKGSIRKLGADYLMYALLDAVIDGYFAVLEELGEEIDDLEDEVVAHPTVGTLRDIHRLKRELIALRRSVWPMREVVNSLLRDESPIVTRGVRMFLRDLYDHTIQVIDTVETLRDIMASALDVYLSSVSNRLNQVMKVLTVVSTIFIPITFVVGVYGMNFHYMPELEWRYGYPAVWAFILVLSAVLLLLFRRKGWM